MHIENNPSSPTLDESKIFLQDFCDESCERGSCIKLQARSPLISLITTTKQSSTRLMSGMTIIFTILISQFALAMEDHGSQIFHKATLETDVGASRDGALYSWDFDGWIGSDNNKLWLKSEGEVLDGETEKAEIWAMYSRNIATFWDAQIGIRYDDKPESTSYFVAGFEGIAPYLVEVEAHFFVSEDGDLSARVHKERDFLITQKLITKPYVEVNFSAQDVPELELGSGVTSGEFGLQTRYEINKKFAPYIDLRYERKFGETSAIAKNNGENRDDTIASVGIKLMF